MRIAIVTHGYPRHAGDVAGAFIARLATALVARGHQVRVILPTDRGRTGPAELEGVSLDWVRYDTAEHETLAYTGTMASALRSPRSLLAFWRLLRGFEKAIRRVAREVDVVHAHWWVPAGLAGHRALGAGDPPLVVTLHGTDVAMLDVVPFAPRLARGVFEHAAAVTAVSSYLGEQARARTGFAGPVRVQPMPVLAGTRPPEAARGTGLVFVGRLTEQKRINLAIDALSTLPTEVTLTIVGDGPARGSLEARARPLGGRVRFRGAVPPEEVATHFEGAGAFVFPAVREGFGLAVAEALLHGVPVIAAADGGGVHDIVTPDAGVLVAPTAGAFAAAARAMIADPAWSVRARVAGGVLAERLAPDTVAAAFERMYAEAGA